MSTSNGVNIKKSMFAIGTSLVLFLVAGTALAVAYAPNMATGGTMMQNPSTITQPTQQVQGINNSNMIMPCPMMEQQTAGNMMYRTYPCDTFNYRSMSLGPFANQSHLAKLVALMFVITVALVWTALLLLILFLFKLLKKHKHS